MLKTLIVLSSFLSGIIPAWGISFNDEALSEIQNLSSSVESLRGHEHDIRYAQWPSILKMPNGTQQQEALAALVMSLEELATERRALGEHFSFVRDAYKYPFLQEAWREIFDRNFIEILRENLHDLDKYPALNKAICRLYLEIPLVAASAQESTIKEYLLNTLSYLPDCEDRLNNMTLEESRFLLSLVKIARTGLAAAVSDPLGTQAKISVQNLENTINRTARYFSESFVLMLKTMPQVIRHISSGFELDENMQRFIHRLNLISSTHTATNE